MESGRRTKASINAELEQLEAQLKIFHQRESDFQQIIDHAQKLKDEVSREREAAERTKIELEGQKEPINWLPNEMLVQIFAALAEITAPSDTYRPSVVVSHVSTKWRALAVSTPQLWGRISVQGTGSLSYAENYLKRSAQWPLELELLPFDARRPSWERHQMVKMMQIFSPHFSRIKSLSIHCRTPLPLVQILHSIKDHTMEFPRLNQLVLAITTTSPSFLEVPSMLGTSNEDLPSPSTPVQSESRLLRLKLEEIPLCNIPASFVANLRSLELVYAPRRLQPREHFYHLKMSSLCRFFALTPQLEELILVNTVPYFDVRLPSDTLADDTAQNLIEMEPVVLHHLKTIDWTFPYSGDVPRFLCMINAPNLEKLDLWVEDTPRRSADMVGMRGYIHTSSPSSYIRGTINYPVLRDLSLQCVGEDTTSIALRRFYMPALEKLAFTNIDTAARTTGGEETPSLPVFPRLESIFRDPRLPNLTHLTLSHFSISLEHGRVEAMLGYMPVLTSLSLDSCSGVHKLLEGLLEHPGGANKAQLGGGGRPLARPRRGVRVCPRLEALSFWGCQDVDFLTLVAVVTSRNRNLNGTSFFSAEGTLQKAEDAPNGATTNTTTTTTLLPITGTTKFLEGNEEDGAAAAATPTPPRLTTANGTETEISHMGRKIKPLRKLRRDLPEMMAGSSSAGRGEGAVSPANFVAAMQEALHPAHIIFLRLMNCKMIDEKQASCFKELGVVDVIWGSSN